MKVGILTAGGDCPGLNAVIRASARKLLAGGHEPVGLLRGYQGLAERNFMPLGHREVSGILQLGGTIISTSSYNPFREENGVALVKSAVEEENIDAVIAIGGEHTMMITRRLFDEQGIPTIGVPKTIDNDVTGTDYTFGFNTAVQIASDAIDRLHTTAESHNRIMILEVMGRNTGWIALFAGIAGGADAIVIPELELTVEEISQNISQRHARGKNFSIVVVAEGAELAYDSGEKLLIRASEDVDLYGFPRLGGIGAALAIELEKATGFDTRVTVLGHIQRGGTPNAYDRILATEYGIKAAELAMNRDFGSMAALRNNQITSVPLSDVTGVKTVDLHYLEVAKTFFG
ncbi:MAG TPA: ATP-dependent 6-phosphofructokinase [Solirubrobacterales bacterium]|jgi:6-phosphofructokinase 1|nr:ATP-dependent 6-phosphofructokinase [Solirubrobacterales bacterium]